MSLWSSDFVVALSTATARSACAVPVAFHPPSGCAHAQAAPHRRQHPTPLSLASLPQADTAAALQSNFVDAALDTNERVAAATNGSAALSVVGAASTPSDPEAPVPCTTGTFPNLGVLAFPRVPRAAVKAVAEALLQLSSEAASSLRFTFDVPQQYWPVVRMADRAAGGPAFYRTCALSDSAADVYGSIVCPSGTYKKSQQQVSSSCEALGRSCAPGFQCICSPCAPVPAELISVFAVGVRLRLFSLLTTNSRSLSAPCFRRSRPSAATPKSCNVPLAFSCPAGAAARLPEAAACVRLAGGARPGADRGGGAAGGRHRGADPCGEPAVPQAGGALALTSPPIALNSPLLRYALSGDGEADETYTTRLSPPSFSATRPRCARPSPSCSPSPSLSESTSRPGPASGSALWAPCSCASPGPPPPPPPTA